MALERVTNSFTLPAAKDLSSFRFRMMTLNTGGQVTNNATAGEVITYGVLLNPDASGTGQSAHVGVAGLLRVEAATAGKPGDALTLAASGKVSNHAEGTGTRQIVVGVALEDYSTGAIFTMVTPAPSHRGEK